MTSIGSSVFYECTALTSVIFENTEGWQRYGKIVSSGEITDLTSISSSLLEDASTAATYLKETYVYDDVLYGYYWERDLAASD